VIFLKNHRVFYIFEIEKAQPVIRPPGLFSLEYKSELFQGAIVCVPLIEQ
jgi:hypothetical protein